MDIARVLPDVIDLEAELVALYPALARRLTLVLHDTDAAQDVAQATALDSAWADGRRLTTDEAVAFALSA